MTQLHELIHPFLVTGADELLRHLALSTVILVLAWAAAAFPRLRGKTVHLILLLALLKFLIPAAAIIYVAGLAGVDLSALRFFDGSGQNAEVILGVPIEVPRGEAPARRSELLCTGAAIWLAGAASILAWSISRWRRLTGSLLATSAAPQENEIAILRDLERRLQLRQPVALRSCPACTSPVVLGIRRPVILVPAPAADSLDPIETEAILAHELGHVVRRDNLIGSLQLVVCALWWWFPPVWLAHRKLCIEREQACDEAVIETTGAAESYLSGIVKICRRAVALPVAGVSCMSRARLKERMNYVMRFETLRARMFPHRPMVFAAALAILAVTVLAAAWTEPAPVSASTSSGGLYSVDARVTPWKEGFYRCILTVRNAEGKILAAPVITVGADGVGTVTTSDQGRTVAIRIELNEQGNGPLTLEVREDDHLVETRTTFVMAEPRQAPPLEGEPITLNLKDAKLSDVIRLFTMLTGVKIESDVPLDGLVTVQLKDAPWQRALSMVLQSSGLTWEWRGSEIGIRKTGIYRVGGDVKPPAVTHRVDPRYPPEARAARVQGIVIIEAMIDETGRVADARVLKPLPFGLAEAALEAVRQWIFEPATIEGRPVPVIFNLTINFRLPEKEQAQPPTQTPAR